jgi:hypothetical protein
MHLPGERFIITSAKWVASVLFPPNFAFERGSNQICHAYEV